MRDQFDNAGNKDNIKRMFPEDYKRIYDPKLSRRQKLAVHVFSILNRERDYDVVGGRRIPSPIKKRDIKSEWKSLTQPINFDFLLLMVQSIDDVFTDYSLEQLKNG